ncbi:MAG: DUF885 domain-containing protein, partial [Burkholderiales bacterium]|nr:DUF885 domain-containing protein [Burkholderiales bacterium]
QELLSYDLFIYEKEHDLKAAAFYPHDLYPLTTNDGLQSELPKLVEVSPFHTEHDYRNYVARLNAVPRYVAGIQAQLDYGIAHGWTAPRVVVEDMPRQLRELAQQLEASTLGKPLREMPAQFSAANKARYRQQIQQALQQKVKPALERIAAYMEKTYVPASRTSIAVSDLPAGPAYYAFLVESATTTKMTPDEIHQLGLQEVARIHQQMQQVMTQTGFSGTMAEFFKKLNTDPQFFYTEPKDLLAGYRDIMAKAHAQLPRFFNHLPKGKVDVKPVPELGAEKQGGAYYEGGSADGSRIGYFVVNTSRLEIRPKWEMATLTMHEAEPGHHLQTAIAQELKGIPEFRRFGWYTAFGEGWALYAEKIGREMGFYEDPYALAGHLNDELFRAARLVVDTGMHAKGWTRQQAIDYMNQNTASPAADNIVEIDRYIAWPAQALSYKIGELKIMQLRQQAQAALGDQFDIRQFHDAVLANGGLPLPMVEQQVLQWQQTIKK